SPSSADPITISAVCAMTPGEPGSADDPQDVSLRINGSGGLEVSWSLADDHTSAYRIRLWKAEGAGDPELVREHGTPAWDTSTVFWGQDVGTAHADVSYCAQVQARSPFGFSAWTPSGNGVGDGDSTCVMADAAASEPVTGVGIEHIFDTSNLRIHWDFDPAGEGLTTDGFRVQLLRGGVQLEESVLVGPSVRERVFESLETGIWYCARVANFTLAGGLSPWTPSGSASCFFLGAAPPAPVLYHSMGYWMQDQGNELSFFSTPACPGGGSEGCELWLLDTSGQLLQQLEEPAVRYSDLPDTDLVVITLLGAEVNTLYCFALFQRNAYGVSPRADVCDLSAPGPITDLSLTELTAVSALLEWQPSAGALEQSVHLIGWDGTALTEEDFEPTHFSVDSLHPNTHYWFAVEAFGDDSRTPLEVLEFTTPVPSADFGLKEEGDDGPYHQDVLRGHAPFTILYQASPDLAGLTDPTFAWNFGVGDGVHSTAESGSWTYTQPGEYPVELTLEVGGYSYSESSVFDVTVQDALLEADFIASTTAGAAPLQVSFQPLVTLNGNAGTFPELTHSWDFDGDGVFDQVGLEPSFTYQETGTYTVTLQVEGYGSAATETKTAHIVAQAVEIDVDTSASYTASPFQTIFHPIHATATDGSALTYQVIASEGMQAATVNSAGLVTLVPITSGNAVVQVSASGATATVHISVTVLGV
ncbi:MAG: PKD domain-containing protein, partial [Holophagales bacterium]|nr:PKD domain-containing protein [Holophagales bacterium]